MNNAGIFDFPELFLQLVKYARIKAEVISRDRVFPTLCTMPRTLSRAYFRGVV